MANLKLIGARFTKVSADRNPDFDGKIEMKTNVKINSLEKVKGAKETLKLSYGFNIEYAELGKVEIEGIIFISGDSKPIKDLLRVQKNKEYNSQEYVMLTNLIMQKASVKAFELEEELGLPIHIKLPTLSVKK